MKAVLKIHYLLVVSIVVTMSLVFVSCSESADNTPSALYSISGTTSSGGTGLAGVIMTLSSAGSATATTDASGNYAFSGLANGNYTVTPRMAGFTFNPASSLQTISGSNITGVSFVATGVSAAQLVACPASGTTNVTIQDFSFTPQNISINVNDIVQWTNNGPSSHTVTSGSSPNPDNTFNSSIMVPGTTFCTQFVTAGTYPYFCLIHTFMTGSVTVR